MLTKTHLSLAAAFCGLLAPSVRAGALTQAEVTRVINDVKLIDPAAGTRPAVEHDLLRNENGLRTGAKSRAELLFQDDTLARLGAETFFSFKTGTRDIKLESGSMLLQVPKGLGGTKIRAAAITAAITGTTVLFEHQPGTDFKLIVLEGTVRLSIGRTLGESMEVTAGKMVIMSPKAKRIPAAVDVDLSLIMKTSGLIKSKDFASKKHGAGQPSLPSEGLIQKEIGRQQKELTNHDLIGTNLMIVGGGNNVLLGSDGTIDALEARVTTAHAQAVAHGPADNSTAIFTAENRNTSVPAPTPDATPAPAIAALHALPTVVTNPDPYVLSKQKFHLEDTKIQLEGGGSPRVNGTLYAGDTLDGSASSFFFGKSTAFDASSGFDALGASDTVPYAAFKFSNLELTAPLDLDLHKPKPGKVGINGLALIGVSSLSTGVPGGVWDLKKLHGLLLATQDGPLTLGSEVSIVGTNELLTAYARGSANGDLGIASAISVPAGSLRLIAGHNLNLTSTITAGKISLVSGAAMDLAGDIHAPLGGSVGIASGDTVNAHSTIEISKNTPGAATNAAGRIAMTSGKTSGVAISINNTGQLLALLDALSPGPGGVITVSSAGGDIQVNGGKMQADKGTIDIRNTGATGAIVLTSANLNADVIKVAALGNDGTLTIGGGNLAADSAIKLYAEGSNGKVHFVDSSTLSGASVKNIAARTVTIDSGKVVTINGGPANVYTSHGNYTGSGGNSTTTGAFGGAGATTHPFNQRPGL